MGSATPDYFGGFYTNIRYKHFALAAEFSYSKGNEAYNAVRRTLESVSSFSNQSVAVTNRWNVEGQVTNIPRASYGDAIGNNNFSSRWIEDASFLRMKSITLSYNFDKPVWNFFRSGTILCDRRKPVDRYQIFGYGSGIRLFIWQQCYTRI